MSETILGLIEARARRDPDAAAILGLDARPLSYGGLLEHVRAKVRQLNAAGISPGDRVALVLPDGPEMATCFLSVAATATCAPLNPAFRAAEFDFYLGDLDAKALILPAGAETAARQIARSRGIPVLELVAESNGPAGSFALRGAGSDRVDDRFSDSGDDALVLHTSGTTSRPKLVPLTQTNLVASARSISLTLGLTAADRCLNVMPLFHIHGLVGAVLSTIAAGASVACPGGFQAPAFMGWLSRFQASWYTAVPTMHQAIAARARDLDAAARRGHLRFIRSSSASLAPSVLVQLEELFGVPVVEAYGMTEAAHQMASNPLPPAQRKPGSVGIAAGPEVAVMAADGSIAASGVIGEVVIRGANLTRGYAHPVEANAAAFQDGWFRTGDQGYLDEDAYLFLTGRLKEIINCGGEKVSPREIDEVLLQHPQVEQAVAFALPDQRLGEVVAAAVVLAADATSGELELKEFATGRVADFKVPRRIVIVDDIPKGATGKLQRIGLAERLGLLDTPPPRNAHDGGYQAPASSAESLLCDLWRDVLGVDRVGVRDDFFGLGGDSVLALQVVVRLRELTGVELSLARMFDAPTVQALAAWLAGAVPGSEDAKPDSVSRAGPGETIVPSLAQEGMWFLDRLTEEPSILNRPLLLRLSGDLQLGPLQRGLSLIVERHEILRTTYHDADGRVQPVVEAPRPVTIPLTDLRPLPAADRWAKVRQLVGEEGQCPFDLQTDAMLRACLFRTGAREHALFLNMHHIASDGWSTRMLLRELAIAYGAGCRRSAPDLPALSIQYGDYARWQRQYLGGPTLEVLEAFWKRTLADLPDPLELPGERSKQVAASHRGAVRSAMLPLPLRDGLRALAAGEGATLFMTLFSGFQILLSRYTGREDFLVGTVVANRRHRETEPLVGLFMNMLALRADLSGQPSFRQLLGRVRSATVAAYNHQDLPYLRVVRVVNPRRQPADDGIVQVLFQLRNLPAASDRLHDLTVEEMETDVGVAGVDLTFETRESPQGIQCLANYNADIFDGAMIERLLEHYAILLDGAVREPDRPVATLPMLTERERQFLLRSENDTARDWPATNVIQEFEAHAATAPDRAALLSEGAPVSYGELNARANRLAHRFRRLGVGRGTRVGLCIERSLHMVVALLGTLKAGAAYVPLDPSYPRERLAMMRDDAALRLIVATTDSRDALPALADTLCIDAEWPSIAGESAENHRTSIEAHDPAYVIYTSGSTGRPKGVVISHDALGNFVRGFRDACALVAEDRTLQVTSLSFDLSVGEIFTSLTAGGCLVLPRPGEQRDPTRLADLLNEARVTVVQTVPSLLSEIIDVPAFSQNTSLRVVVSGGEALPAELQQRFAQRCDALLINAYGPTEATVFATTWCCPGTRGDSPRVPIGSPLANYQVHVLDGDCQPVPVGVIGELYIGGRGLAGGYFKAPRLTAEKFVPNPFSSRPGARLYKTGDRARQLEDGSLDILGRLDDQVKIRGFRVELGELEWALRRHPDVAEATAIRCDDPGGEPTVAAYFIARVGAEPSVQALREWLSRTLPAYMVPSWFVRLDAFPRMPNGKLDRRAFPRPQPLDDKPPPEAPAGRSPLAAAITAAWAEVLGHTRFDDDSDFFAVGGDSLKAIRCLSRIKNALGKDVTVAMFFEHPTVEGLARAVASEGVNGAPQPIAARGRSVPKELSPGQERIWFLDRLVPEGSAYNVAEAFRWIGQLDREVLARSLSALVDRHEILRTIYQENDSRPMQIVRSRRDVDIGFSDLRDSPAIDRLETAMHALGREAARPFDLAVDPPLRVFVWQLGDGESLVLVNVHHIACDAASFDILYHELSEFYEAFRGGRAPSLPDLPTQYADFARWQGQGSVAEQRSEAEAYWQERLTPLPEPLPLPLGNARPDWGDLRAGVATLNVSADVAESARVLGVRLGTTEFVVLAAAFQALLSRLSGQADIAIGTPLSARDQLQFEPLIGLFTNTTVLRLDLGGDPSFETLLHRAGEMVRGALAFGHLPFQAVVEALNPPRMLGRHPLFDVLLELNDRDRLGPRVDGIRIEPVAVPVAEARFALVVHVDKRADGLRLRAIYRRALFAERFVQHLLRQFATLLAAAAADPATPLSRLPLLTGEERRRILFDWNATAADCPSGCVHELIEKQVQCTPEAIAVVDGETSWTFDELNRRANRIAHRLRDMGVGPEVLVGLHLHRQPAMVGAVLGILKAGGAYVSLDRQWPSGRLAAVIDDARLSIVITDESGAGSLPGGVKSLICALASEPGGRSLDSNPARLNQARNLAYAIYTSGSTGSPKGVMIEHRSLVNYVWGILGSLNLRAMRSFALLQPLSVDASVTTLFGSLLAGARLHLLSEEQALDAAALSRIFGDRPVDCLKIAPAHLKAINAALPQPLMPRKTLMVGGEGSPSEWLSSLRRAAPDCEIVNHYGPTEATVGATTFSGIASVNGPSGSMAPIGRPLPNVCAYVLDERGEPVTVGVEGELYLGGDCLARGYHGKPALTAQAFVPDPFSTAAGARLYRTGDRARYLASGDLQCLGRRDGQIKIRGYRVELDEIEAVIAQQPGVRDVAVTAEEVGDAEIRLVANVVPADVPDLTLGGLRGALGEHLPDYMLPRALRFHAFLPRTAQGKLDRRALHSLEPIAQEPGGGRPGDSPVGGTPRKPIEEGLLDVWSRVLGVEDIGIHDNFFEIGGHSLSVVRVVSLLRSELATEISIRSMFDHPTVAELAAAITDAPISPFNSR